MAARQASFKGCAPASRSASTAARGSSKKTDTKPELALRKALWALGLRYRKNVADLPGRPDVVFSAARVVVFCDGDFWHGRNWELRKARLAKGHNAPYWVAKLERNMERDRLRGETLEAQGWLVFRFWETDILRNPEGIAQRIARVVSAQRAGG